MVARKINPAFTLIELLVVIAIIGLLMAILLPALEHVRHQSYITKCASNLHQIGAALTVYAEENHGSFPAPGTFQISHLPQALVLLLQIRLLLAASRTTM